MTRYEELLTHLFSLKRTQKTERTLSRMETLASLLGSPQQSFPSIHIAGTNGKGSVATKMAHALAQGPYKVGLFTSPHLFTFCERIQISGKMISKEEVTSGLEHLFALIKELQVEPLFFELTTLLAFRYFAKNKVDIAVIETGLGGRLDATNVITPLLSVITTIDYDHQDILGKSLDAIACEKGGIIKEGCPVILGAKANRPILHEIAAKKKAPLTVLEEDSNTTLARAALLKIRKRFPLFDNQIEKGLLKTPPCRFEKKGGFLFDVAHNPSGFKRLFDHLKTAYPQKSISLVLALTKEDQLETLGELFKENEVRLLLYPASSKKCLSPSFLAGIFKKHGCKDVQILEKGGKIAQSPGQLFVVAGSFYMMQDLYPSTSELKASASLNIM